jgi:hypothetical protein
MPASPNKSFLFRSFTPGPCITAPSALKREPLAHVLDCAKCAQAHWCHPARKMTSPVGRTTNWAR